LLDHFSNSSFYMIPVIAFMMGITGSLHCIAMCGAFSTSCSSTSRHQLLYQTGRMISYSLLGIIAGILGLSFQSFFKHPMVQVIPSIILGFFFVWWGISLYQNKKIEIVKIIPKSFMRLTTRLLGKSYQNPSSHGRSFSIGFLSAFLPCGLLYGVVISLALFQNPLVGMVGMFSFALGTIPGLVISPIIIKKIMKPLKELLPKTTSLSLVGLGLITIIYRIYISYEQATCH
jgi:sulfite exporter TauE/SafE